jgi:uncharacterized protein YaiE (UPF0345 family)
MIKVNEYLEGKVKSLGAEFGGEYFTSGIMLPGEYHFNTEKEERIEVTLGVLNIRWGNMEWKKVAKGETVVVPRNMSFQLNIEKTVAYICFYK